MSLLQTLDRLSHALRTAPGLPLSGSCRVNRAELLALVEQALTELPPEIEESIALLGRREAFITAAQREADAIVADARRRAESLVENSAVVFRAKIRAEELVNTATTQAATARRDADDWCDRRLGALEAELERTLGQLRRGRLVLEQRLTFAAEQAQLAERAQLAEQTQWAEQAKPAEQDRAADSARASAARRALTDPPPVDEVVDLRDGRAPSRYVVPRSPRKREPEATGSSVDPPEDPPDGEDGLGQRSHLQ